MGRAEMAKCSRLGADLQRTKYFDVTGVARLGQSLGMVTVGSLAVGLLELDFVMPTALGPFER